MIRSLVSRWRTAVVAVPCLMAALAVAPGCGSAPVAPARAEAASSAPAPAPAGTVLWTLAQGRAAHGEVGDRAFSRWLDRDAAGRLAVQVRVAAGAATGSHTVRIPVDLTPWRGMVMALSGTATARGVSTPPQHWNGVKCMLHTLSPSAGAIWANENHVAGTFQDRQLQVLVAIPEDATQGWVYLGLEDSSGEVEFADVALRVVRHRAERPAPRPDAPPAYRGHDLPRLRGVMSPNQYDPKDFAELERWKVNLVRWQMGRNWGRPGQELDLADYDRWLESELDDAVQALDDAAKRGMQVLLDLHTPPGGRTSDGTVRMVLEQPYQDHFVQVWRRIAQRVKGHPALWAYDLINEPAQNRLSPPGLADWLGVQVLAAKAVRAIDPVTAICIEVDNWDNPRNFTWLTPVDVPNVIYQAHMYWPGEFTHQGVHNDWGEQGSARRTTYPGVYYGAQVDREALRRYLQPVRDFQLAHNVHIVIGEFSAVRWADGADRYLADCVSIFEEYGWDWSYHAFREWGGWSLEAADLPYDTAKHPLAPQPTRRKQVLQDWFDRNQRP